MRGFAFVAALLALAACQKEPVPDSSATAPETAAPPGAATRQATAVEGWETARSAHLLLGATLPGFTAKRLGGGETTQEDLRNRWTVLGFWSGSGEGAKEEMRYIGALNSAANQDPNLDFLSVYLAGDGSFDVQKWGSGAEAWPTVIGDAAMTDSFGIEGAPAYLLVGPDLTIEAYRGALTKTPDDGIKSVIRGVAEIKKQIAAPE
jgi:hypothetical protein